MNTALFGQLRALNVVRDDPDPVPFQGSADLSLLPPIGVPSRRAFIEAIVARLDPDAPDAPVHAFLDVDWPVLGASYLDQLAVRRAPFLADFVADSRFIPGLVRLAQRRSMAMGAMRVLLNVIASSETPSALCERLLSADLVACLDQVLTAPDAALDAMLQAGELLSIVSMFSGDRRRSSGFVADQIQLGRVAARAFHLAHALYADLQDPDAGLDRYRRHLIVDSSEMAPADLQFDWERSPRLIAKLIESLSRSFLFLHVTADPTLTTLLLDRPDDGTPPMAELALRCLSANGGVVPALPISRTGTNLADAIAVLCHLDPLFTLEPDRIHFCSEAFYATCCTRWRYQADCIRALLRCDADDGRLLHDLVHWIATDPRSKPKILEGRKRFHPEADLGEDSIIEFIGQILATTQSALSALANVSRLQPMLTAIASELVVFYQSLSALGTDAYGDDVRLIGYETTTGGAVNSVCVHVTPTIFEGLATILVQQHLRHQQPLAIETSQLEVIARTTASEAKARGNELIASGQLDAAIAAYTTAINLLDFAPFRDSDEFVASIANRSECFLRKQSYESAYLDASRALQQRPDNAKFQRRFEKAQAHCSITS